jgi:RNA polymerase sigma-70 factor, ECF subfamily
MEYSDEDIALMLRFQNGEERCFEELVDRHKQRVFNIAYRYVGNVQDAEDVAQQVFINIYNARKSYVPKAQFTTWLYTICKNTCLKTFRKKRLKTISIDADVDLGEDSVAVQLPDQNGFTPLDSAINAEQDLAVKAAVDSLPENQRIVVVLYKYEQLSYEKIAEITGFSIKAVKSLLHRARVSLKEKLAGYFNK